MKLEELIGSLQTLELKFRSPIKKKSVTLKIDEDSSPENDLDEGMALFAHKCKKLMKFNAMSFRKKLPPNRQNQNQNHRMQMFPKEEPVCYECKGCGHLASKCANKIKKMMDQGKAMVATWDNELDESDVESQYNEDEFSHEVRAFVPFAREPEISPSEYEEADEGEEEVDEGEEDLQEAYNEMYNESVKLIKTNQ